MGTTIRNYDFVKKQSLLKNIDLSLEEMYILKEKLNQLNSSYSDVDFYCYINKFYNKFNESLEMSKKCINKVFADCEEAERTTSRRLSELKLKLEILNMETKVLNGVCDLRCTFEKNSFQNFIKPSAEEFLTILEFYSTDEKWKVILNRNAEEITDEDNMILAMIFLSLEDGDVSEFLSEFYDKKSYEDNKFGIITEAGKGVFPVRVREIKPAHSIWKLDTGKLSNFSDMLSILQYQKYCEALAFKIHGIDDDNNESLNSYKLAMQRNSLTKALSKITEVKSPFKDQIGFFLGLNKMVT